MKLPFTLLGGLPLRLLLESLLAEMTDTYTIPPTAFFLKSTAGKLKQRRRGSIIVLTKVSVKTLTWNFKEKEQTLV